MNKLLKSALFIAAFSTVVCVAYLLTGDKYLSNTIPQYDFPDKASQFEFKRTVDPSLGYVPVDRLYESYEMVKGKFYNPNARSIAGVEWIERGPNNFGGRTRAIIFDPNDKTNKRVIAAGVTGGLWTNEDVTSPHSSWINQNDFLTTLNITSLAYDPNDHSKFYFGSGEGFYGGGMVQGNGIYKSSDGGNSWVELEATQTDNFDYVQKVVVTNSSTLLAASRSEAGGGGIYRSADDGVTWEKVIEANIGADIEIVGSTIYASTGLFIPGKLWKSQDDGVTWEDITPATGGERIEIGVHPNHTNTIYAVASSGNDVAWFYRSDNAGESWVKLDVPFYLNSSSCGDSGDDFTRGQAWYDLILAVHPVDSKIVVVGGIDLHRSTDGGGSWEPISYWTSACEIYVHADQHNFLYRPGYNDQVIATNDGGVYYSADILTPKDDGGPVFESRNLDFNVTQFYACAMLNESGSSYFLAGAQDNGSHQFDQKGVNSTFEVTGGDGAFCFIDQLDGDIQITSYVYNSYYITKDFWETVESIGSSSKGEFINPTDYNSNTKTLFAAGGSNEILRYKIGEETLVEETLTPITGSVSAITVSPHDDDVLFVGASGSVFKVTDSNSDTPASTDISGTDFPVGYINNVAVGASDDHLMVIFSNYGVESVWETTDGGATWAAKEGELPDMPIRWALYNPNNYSEVLLATDLGVWSTDDITVSAPVWEPTNEGLANVRVDMIKYRSSDGLVAVATHGRGLYTTDVFSNQSIADFYAPHVIGYEGEAMVFQDASTKAVSYAWSFGDGSTSTDRNPTHSFATSGSYDVTLTLNGDNQVTSTQTVRILPKADLDFGVDDGGSFDVNPELFYAYTASGTGFELGSTTIVGKDGTRSGDNAWVTGLDSLTYEPYSESYLYTPQFDFTYSGDYIVEFYTKYQLEDEWDGFILEYSLDNGMTWEKAGDYIDEVNWYNQITIDQAIAFPPGKAFFSGDTGGEFVKKSINLSSLSVNAKVSFRFVFKTDPASEEAGIVIDDFSIAGPSTSSTSVAFSSSMEETCIDDIVTFSNNSSGAITAYTWDFGEDATPATAEGFGPHEVFYTSDGTKTISLTGTTAGGDEVITSDLVVGAKPAELTPIANDTKLCEGEPAVISLEASEAGILYQLFEVASGDLVGTQVEGNGGLLDLISDNLDVGSHEFGVIATKVGGCDITLKPSHIFKAVSKIDISISKKGSVNLEGSYVWGDSYQWYLNGELIEGATDVKFTAEGEGTYVIEVEEDGCISASEPFELVILGLTGNNVVIYPNPAFETIGIKYNGKISRVELVDAAGKIIADKIIRNADESNLDVSDLEPGVYFVRQYSKEKVIVGTSKVIIK